MQKLENKTVAVPTNICNKCGKEMNYRAHDCVTINLYRMAPIPDRKDYYSGIVGANQEDLCKACGTELYEQLSKVVSNYRATYKHPHIPITPNRGYEET